MAYEHLGAGALDYFPCRYGESRLQFRGPPAALDMPYVAVLGGSEIYGRFAETPLPARLEQRIGMPAVNLACINAGLDMALQDEVVMQICRDAAATVIQITGVQNVSNRFYSVHPRRNDRFLKASAELLALFDGIDLTEFNFTRHLLASLAQRSAEGFAEFQKALKEDWLVRMRQLIDGIGGPVVLLWLSDRRPEDPCDNWSMRDPLFVDRLMLDAVSVQTAGLVEVVASTEEIGAGFQRLVCVPLEELAAREMLGPVVHERAAQELVGKLASLLQG